MCVCVGIGDLYTLTPWNSPLRSVAAALPLSWLLLSSTVSLSPRALQLSFAGLCSGPGRLPSAVSPCFTHTCPFLSRTCSLIVVPVNHPALYLHNYPSYIFCITLSSKSATSSSFRVRMSLTVLMDALKMLYATPKAVPLFPSIRRLHISTICCTVSPRRDKTISFT